ncbi:MAG: precorrin-8X methylmutase [Lachnospiraceae bacterium]|nr:precorrin-8X methylmutase [Lachnospiraceae bacterium]
MYDLIKPEDIEKRSFEIIKDKLKAQNISVPFDYEAKSAEELELCRSIIYRCIHTTADFDYAQTMRFSQGSVDIIRELLLKGADIITDTNMALAGINKKRLEAFGGRVHCFMADEDVARRAEETGMTRASMSMEKAVGLHKANPAKPVIFAVGNAPTALISLHKLYYEGDFKPDFIIGVPVGFVNVVASKELIKHSDIPFIINEGCKGGSSVAAAIVNAILYHI